ncbi:hypothetical protein ACFV6B_39110 [Streptomyces microflavus]|uniref:hypothetical protein n=1 Tax=Streptomyces microflavus TaxID=1919 RepID=UPI003652D926
MPRKEPHARPTSSPASHHPHRCRRRVVRQRTLPVETATPSSAIANDTVWTDTDGNEILAQGGNLLEVGSMYYWVGQKLVSGEPKAVNLYSSTDLEN